MFKKICTSVFLLLAILSFGQESQLIQNINYRAKELKHSLTSNGDSLLLKAERKIYNVKIYNSDFEKNIEVNDSTVTIAVNDFPLGRYVIDAKLQNKHIIMTLLRNESPDFVSKEEDNVEEIDTTSQNTEAKKNVIIDKHANLLSKKLNKNTNTKRTLYWMKYQVNNGNSSHKAMKLVDKQLVDKLILRHKKELSTPQGKNNQLTIWEVYDTKEFMKNQVSNPNYINSTVSQIFNVEPYYSTLSK